MGVSLVILIECMVFCHHFIRGVQLFQNWWKLGAGGGGIWKSLLEREGVRQNGGGFVKKWGNGWIAILYWGF